MQVKVKVIATAKHPNRPEGEEYMLPEALLATLTDRGFVRSAEIVEPLIEVEPDPIMPRVVKVIKPRKRK